MLQRKRRFSIGVLLRTSLLATSILYASGFAFPAMAAESGGEIQELKQQMQAMMQRIKELEAKQTKPVDEKVVAEEKKATDLAKAVQPYGQARLSVDNYSDDFGEGKDGAGGKGSTIKSNASRFGIKGEMPTSFDGTNMIYQAEVLYGAADNATNEIQWREGFAGLQGGWGKTRLGRLDVPYKTTLTTVDPWNDNAPQSRGFGGVQGSSALHASYFTNTAEYISPSFKGVNISAWYSDQLDDETSGIHDASPISNYQGGEAKGLGVNFKQGGLFLGADWIDVNATRIGTTSSTATANLTTGVVSSATTFSANNKMHNDSGWQAAAKYGQGPWSVAAFYEDVKDLGLGANTYVNGIYKIGNTSLIATYGLNRDATQYSNRDIDTWSLGTKYALTKTSELFAAWVNRSEDAYGSTPSKDYQILTVGMNAKFGY